LEIKKYFKNILKSILNKECGKQITVNVLTTSPSEKLKGKNILITGGGRGLGYYIAKRAVLEGANVVITGRSQETLKKATDKLGDTVKYLVFDVRNVEDVKTLFAKAEKILGDKVNALVSNAGISLHEGDFRNVTEENWDMQIDTNLKGNYFAVTEFIKYLEGKEDKSGNIVVITSERAKRPDDIPYGISKTATSSFVQCIATKVIAEGIRVNGIGPGVTASDMTGFDKDGNMYAQWQPTERIFMPEEVAEVATFLLSDVSSCINGEIITCDQGRYISRW